MRKTFSYLNKSYYSFEARNSVNHIVSKCPVCRLNNYPRGNATKTGNQIELAPNQTGQMDFCGPLHGFCQTQAGNPRYLLVFVDTHSRFTIVVVTSSTADKEVLRSLRVIKDKLCGLPNRIICDNAILTKNSDSLQYCKDNGVAVAHGLPHISRSQSKVERQIQNIMRLICKLHTETPNLPFQRLVEDATFILNSTPNDGLGGELSPKELFFSNAPSNLPRMKPLAAGPLRRARLASQESAINEVRRFMKNRVKTSPTDYSQRLKPGTLALKKRTSFPTSSPRKMARKIEIDGFRIKKRLATNSYEVENIRSKQRLVLPGDQLVTVGTLTEIELVALINEMEELSTRTFVGNSLQRTGPEAGTEREDSTPEPRPRRSRRLRGDQPEVAEVASIDFLL